MSTSFKFFIFFNFLIFTKVYISFGQNFQTLHVDFIRIVNDNIYAETMKGHIYYFDNNLIIITKEPINQWMVLENKNLTIYYPDKKIAYLIKSQNSFILPFYQYFTGFTDENLGLVKFGYTIYMNEIHGDTLLIYWKPPKNADKLVGTFILSLKNNVIIKAESRKPNGKALTKATFNNYLEFNNHFFPLEIKTISYLKEEITTESVLYSNPAFNDTIPKQILEFKLPENIEVKEVEW